jgi:hypothetical protein
MPWASNPIGHSTAMNNKRFAFTLLFILTMPFVVTADSDARIEITPMENLIAYPGDTVQQFADVEYFGEDTTTLKLQLQFGLQSTFSGDGQEITFNSGESNRFIWTMTLPQSTSYGDQTLEISIIDLSDNTIVYSNETLEITAPSVIQFGNIQSSTFVIDPGITTNVATNITSNASLPDDVTFTVQTTSSWNWGWNMEEISGDTSGLILSPDSMDFVRIWIEAPLIIDGAPLAYEGPTFTLIGTSGLDYATISWEFSLELTAFRNVTIDSVERNVTLDPGGNERIEVVVRNTGNTPDTISMMLGDVVIDGVTKQLDKADRLTSDGWTVALFNAFEDVYLFPNQTRIIQIGVEAPPQTSGTIAVDVFIQPTNFPFRSVQETAQTEIDWIRSVEENIQPTDCLYIQPGDSCVATLNIENKGNFEDQFLIEVLSIPEFVSSVDIPSEQITLPRYGTLTQNVIQITVDENATAYAQGTVIFQMKFEGGLEVQTYEVDVLVGPNVNWSFLDADYEVDSTDTLSFSMRLRNGGNLNDGLIVLLRSSHSTAMGFNPPEGAIIEDGIEYPRTFEIEGLPRDANFTLRGTADVPDNQITNGTLVLDIVIRSIYDPETEFIYTIEQEFLGESWKMEEEGDSYSFSDFTSDAIEIFMGWWLVIAAVAIASVVLNKAVRDRIQRKELDLLQHNYEQKKPEEEGDWLQKFERKDSSELEVIESPQVSSEQFKAVFKASSKPSSQALQPLPEDVRNVATTVLDHHALEAQRNQMDELASSIQSEGIARQHNENLSLQPSQHVPERTIRHDRQNLMSQNRMVKAPSTPKSKISDEFDL